MHILRIVIDIIILPLQHGNGVTSKDELVAPEGWAWTSEWAVDTNRAVDEDGNKLLLVWTNVPCPLQTSQRSFAKWSERKLRKGK